MSAIFSTLWWNPILYTILTLTDTSCLWHLFFPPFNSENLCFKSCGYSLIKVQTLWYVTNKWIKTVPGYAYSSKYLPIFTRTFSMPLLPLHHKLPPWDTINGHQTWLWVISSAHHLDDSIACFLLHSDSQMTVYQKEFVFTTDKNNPHPFYSVPFSLL